MSGRGKRLWAPNLSFSQSYALTLAFIESCQKHNLLASYNDKPELIHLYHISHPWPTEGLIEATSVLRFGYSNNPILDQHKQGMARLLSAALKMHYIHAEDSSVVHEPYLFSIPDLGIPGRFRYGLIYPIETKGKQSTIIASQWDLSGSSSQLIRLNPSQKYSTVLSTQNYKWLYKKRGYLIREEMKQHPFFEAGPLRNALLNEIRTHLNANEFPYGKIIDYPIELNEELKAVGALYAPGIRKWFLPKGIDIESTQEYLGYIERLTPQERYQNRWLSLKSPPKN